MRQGGKAEGCRSAAAPPTSYGSGDGMFWAHFTRRGLRKRGRSSRMQAAHEDRPSLSGLCVRPPKQG
jgi:hypothetical protein